MWPTHAGFGKAHLIKRWFNDTFVKSFHRLHGALKLYSEPFAARSNKKRAQRPPNPAPACQSLFPRLQEPTPDSGARPYCEASNPRGAPRSRHIKEQIGYPPVHGYCVTFPGDRPGWLSLAIRLSPLSSDRYHREFCSIKISGRADVSLLIINHIPKSVIIWDASENRDRPA